MPVEADLHRCRVCENLHDRWVGSVWVCVSYGQAVTPQMHLHDADLHADLQARVSPHGGTRSQIIWWEGVKKTYRTKAVLLRSELI